MLNAAVQLFFLRELSFAHFAFPRWQAVLAISLLGLLASFDPNLRAAPPDHPPPPIGLIVPAIILGVWAGFLVFLGILKPWLRRGGRWDGQGDLFNLLAASWLVTDLLVIGLTNLSVPMPFVLPLGLYSLWVGANALTSAIPRASLGYCFAGIFLCLLPAVVSSGIVMVLSGMVSLYLGALLGMLPTGA
ncbi:MAG TPA: hypothetical protein DCY89_09620 [Gammaproteobacteria bacterium]|nr:hypothetical protein [Gammaproteobacteria bacterium]